MAESRAAHTVEHAWGTTTQGKYVHCQPSAWFHSLCFCVQELRKSVPEERHLSSAQPPEVFFHSSMQYDHTIKRWEHEWAGSQAYGSRNVTVPLLIEVWFLASTVPCRRDTLVLLVEAGICSVPS